MSVERMYTELPLKSNGLDSTALIEIRLLVRLRNSSVCYLSLFQSQYLPVRILSEIMIHIVLIIRSDIKISDIDNTSSFTTNVIVTRIETVD